MDYISDPAALERIYGPAPAGPASEGPDGPTSAVLTTGHRDFLAVATMVVIASVDRGGVTCSPRGLQDDALALVLDERTLWLPDTGGRGHQTVRNLMEDPRIGLLFLAPHRHDVLRLQGTARVSIDRDAIGRFTTMDPPARSVVVVDVDTVRLSGRGPLRRAGLWPEAVPG